MAKVKNRIIILDPFVGINMWVMKKKEKKEVSPVTHTTFSFTSPKNTKFFSQLDTELRKPTGFTFINSLKHPENTFEIELKPFSICKIRIISWNVKIVTCEAANSPFHS